MAPRIWFAIAVTMALAATLTVNFGARSVAAQGNEQDITVSAKKFEFDPAEIRVKAGAHVKLTITSTDRDHGIQISQYAEGAPTSGDPGLKFAASVTKPQFKLPKDQAVTVEFDAVKPGTYDFKCSEFCGTGHRNMKGTIVVE
jgi:cytochrome c oxidase subunit II